MPVRVVVRKGGDKGYRAPNVIAKTKSGQPIYERSKLRYTGQDTFADMRGASPGDFKEVEFLTYSPEDHDEAAGVYEKLACAHEKIIGKHQEATKALSQRGAKPDDPRMNRALRASALHDRHIEDLRGIATMHKYAAAWKRNFTKSVAAALGGQ